MCFNVTVFTKSLKCYMLHIFLGCVILKRSDLFLPQNNCGDFFCGHLCLQPNLVLMAESEGRQQGKSVSNVCLTSSLIICTHLQRVCQKKMRSWCVKMENAFLKLQCIKYRIIIMHYNPV